MPQLQELKEMAGEMVAWASVLRLLPPQPRPGQVAENGWNYRKSRYFVIKRKKTAYILMLSNTGSSGPDWPFWRCKFTPRGCKFDIVVEIDEPLNVGCCPLVDGGQQDVVQFAMKM